MTVLRRNTHQEQVVHIFDRFISSTFVLRHNIYTSFYLLCVNYYTYMMFIKSCLVFLSLKIILARHHRDSSYLSHVERVHEFPCSEPQLRAVPIRDLLEIGPSPDEMFYPSSTVLSRCANSGCCQEANEMCAPLEIRNVSLVFMVKHLIDRQRDRHHEIIHAVDHVKCACVNNNNV